MFAATRCVDDFDRASFLMDKALLANARKAMREEQMGCPRHDADYGAQWIWDYYCGRHREKYGEGFAPDITPGWDHSSLHPPVAPAE
jgi:hypothetical protein